MIIIIYYYYYYYYYYYISVCPIMGIQGCLDRNKQAVSRSLLTKETKN